MLFKNSFVLLPNISFPLLLFVIHLLAGVEWCNFEEDTNVLFKKKFLITFQYDLLLASNMDNDNISNIS